MGPLRLAICDDLPEEREALLALLAQAPIATVCTQFGSSEELLKAFQPGDFTQGYASDVMETKAAAVSVILDVPADTPSSVHYRVNIWRG